MERVEGKVECQGVDAGVLGHWPFLLWSHLNNTLCVIPAVRSMMLASFKGDILSVFISFLLVEQITG